MKKSIVALSTLVVALLCNSVVQAYTWPISNFTGDTLFVQVELWGSNSPYFALIKPHTFHTFEWSFGSGKEKHCLNKIKYVKVDDAFLEANKEIIKKSDSGFSEVNNSAMLTWLKAHASQYPRHEVKIESAKKGEKISLCSSLDIALAQNEAGVITARAATK